MAKKIRAAAIILHDNPSYALRSNDLVATEGRLKILLIQRKKNEHEFYAIPGGTVEVGETPEMAVMREVMEEASLEVSLIRPIYFGWIADKLDEHFYLCQYVSGTPRLSDNAIEHTRMQAGNFYLPVWVPLDQLQTLEIHPSEIIEQLLGDIKTGFSSGITKIELTQTAKVKYLVADSL